jgi:preprotein translocase subunit SecA
MGLFSRLFGSSRPPLAGCRVWIDEAAETRAILRDVAEQLAARGSVLVLAHFPTTLAAMTAALHNRGIPHDPFPVRLDPVQLRRTTEAAKTPAVLCGLVRDLAPGPYPEPDHDAPFEVVVVERHFLRRHDDAAVAFADGLGCLATFHTSLGSPFMRRFAGDWVRGMLQYLGMKENEPIDSPMVTRRIGKAQDKLVAQVEMEQPADSPEEWVRLNLDQGQ